LQNHALHVHQSSNIILNVIIFSHYFPHILLIFHKNLIVKWHTTRMVYIKLINIFIINNLFPYFMLIILKRIVTLYFGTTLGYATICQLKEWLNMLFKCQREFCRFPLKEVP
jgi:hypothetical protein